MTLFIRKGPFRELQRMWCKVVRGRPSCSYGVTARSGTWMSSSVFIHSGSIPIAKFENFVHCRQLTSAALFRPFQRLSIVDSGTSFGSLYSSVLTASPAKQRLCNQAEYFFNCLNNSLLHLDIGTHSSVLGQILVSENFYFKTTM